MRAYETLFIIKPDLEEEQITAVIDKFKGIIENHGGEITKLDKWGKRRLAYEIDHTREGFYVVIKFKADSDTSKELDRVFKITDGIMRHIIVREDE
ncbi:30S ribosomal protein S6 [Desulfolucanica intricata]|uniref:30S ribosomal protein S6 n=1 Tax=Desulfolucanica intricata TaxID=1285191 RepID=UPI000835A57D|nr:30S ribosomal protein S6 [Desulfolucanica intricata]